MDISQLHFLVAEGNPAQRQALTDLVTRMGAGKVSQAADGHIALSCLLDAAAAPHIALVDLELPGIDGLELIRRLSEAKSDIEIIIVSGQSSSLLFSVETMAQAYGIDMLGTLDRPVGAAKLQELIANYGPRRVPPPRRPHPEFTFAQVGQGLQARQFEPYFQPKIELATGQVKGMEMFARWIHPEFGVLGTQDFIHALKANNRVDFLDWSLIEKSVAACRLLHDQGIPISISINVSPRTLGQPLFMQQMSACLARHRMLADYVTFEMPESAVLSTDPHLLERLLRLRMQGFGLAIDDYGTGSSNLQLLARIPFSELKIDRSFVDGASKKHALGTVLRSCLGLASSLERRSVAVGVETKADWDFLLGLGCTYAQGYYIARPMPVQEIPGWLEDWRHFF